MNIIGEFERTRVDYNELISHCIKSIPDKRTVDYSVIIPVHGRMQFTKVVAGHFHRATEYYGASVAITFVEHDVAPRHADYVPNWCNYIFVRMGPDDIFNKSLCHNVGALFSNESQYKIFHDIDTLVPDYFFLFLHQNLNDFKAVQCFTKQRLLLCDENVTKHIIAGKTSIRRLHRFSEGISEAGFGAQGGSICIESETFFKCGGFDTFFTGYSVEDAMFFHKVRTVTDFGFCDNPPIEMFHLHHEPSFGRKTKPDDLEYYHLFLNMEPEQKKEFVELQSTCLKTYRK